MAFHKSDIWNCHPDLEAEWGQFASDCQTSAMRNLTSDLWMNFYHSELPATTSNDVKTDSPPSGQNPKPEVNESPQVSPAASVKEKMELQAEDVALTDSQLQQISSISMELLDILHTSCENIPDDLKEDISSLSSHEMAALLKDLGSQLTNQGAYNFCTLLCKKIDGRPWVNATLVFEILFLPMLSGNSLKSIAEEVKAGLTQMTEHFPSECVSYLLKPLLACELKSPSHLELLSGLTPSLPEKDFMSLLRYFVEHCSAPIEEWRILVLNNLLSKVRPDILETKVDSPLLDLLPVLSASATMLSVSELFASLLLKVIPALKWNTSTRIHNELVTIVQLNNSFNKQALMNAIKSIRA